MTSSPSPWCGIICALALAGGLGPVASAAPGTSGGTDALAQDGETKGSDGPEKKEAPAPHQAKPAKAEPKGWHRQGLGLEKGKSRIELAGYAQGDFRRFDWRVKGDELGSLQAPEREFRRLRVGAKGDLHDLSFEFVMDPRNSEKGSRLKDATLGYRFSKEASLLVGHFKPPVSPEFLTSGSRTDFLDRNMIASRLAPDRDWGAGLSGDLGGVEYSLGAFRGDGDSSVRRARTSGAGRVSVHVFKGLQVAGSFMQGEVRADPRVGTIEPSAKGASGATASGFTFWNHPHVDGTRRRLGSDVSYSRGPFRFRAEYLEEREERKGQGSTGQDIPDVRGRGWSVQASYVLTGEKKGSTVVPRKSIFRGGMGALELAARVEALKFDDTGDPSGFAGFGNRSRNLSPSGASAVQAGLNYWASSFLKFQANALWENYHDALTAPVPGNKGRYFTLLGRVQVMTP